MHTQANKHSLSGGDTSQIPKMHARRQMLCFMTHVRRGNNLLDIITSSSLVNAKGKQRHTDKATEAQRHELDGQSTGAHTSTFRRCRHAH